MVAFQAAGAQIQHMLLRFLRRLLMDVEDHDTVGVEVIEDAPIFAGIGYALLVARLADDGHGLGRRRAEALALLKAAQQGAGLYAALNREGRRFDFSGQPDQGFLRFRHVS